MDLYLDTYESAIGRILLVSKEAKLVALDYADYEQRMRRLLQLRHGAAHLSPGSCPSEIKDRLHAYFAGDLSSLEGIPVSTGGTVFQQEVWASLREITPGKTRTYGEIAQGLGRAKSSRAVGAANGANPIAFVSPGHRKQRITNRLCGGTRKKTVAAPSRAVLIEAGQPLKLCLYQIGLVGTPRARAAKADLVDTDENILAR